MNYSANGSKYSGGYSRMELSLSLTLYSVLIAVPGVLKISGTLVFGGIGILITSVIVQAFPIYGPQSIFTC